MQFSNTVTIDRQRDDVFAFLSDFENVPAWNYAIARTSRIGNGPVGVGTRYTQTRTLPRPAEESFEVIAFASPHHLAIRGVLGPFHAETGYQLEADGETTVLTNSMNLEATGVMRVAASLAGSRVQKAVAGNLQALKVLLEQG
jgi:carbon monoxide dehydrogenase subunit G